MLRILKYLNARQWALVAAAVVLIVAQVGLDLRLPDFMSDITRLVETPGSQMGQVLVAGGWMLLCALGSMVCAIGVGYLVALISTGLATTLRGEVFSHAVGLAKSDADRIGTASLVNRATNDITQVQMVIVMGMQAMVKAPITAVWAVLKIVGFGWQWSLATGVSALFIVVMMVVIFFYVVPRFKLIQKLSDGINRYMQEHLVGIRPVRAYNAETFEQTRFKDANDKLTRNNLQAFRVMALVGPMMSFVTSALTLAIYWIGAYLVQGAVGPVRLDKFSEMVVFSNYAMQVIMSFMMLNMVFVVYPRAQVSARRILEAIDAKSNITDGPGVAQTDERGTVAFRNVSFAYPDGTRALTDVSFVAGPGQTVAFIGATGSGKTSLVQLVDRLYDASAGQVLVDGHDVREYTLDQLRARIGYIPQTAVLFSGTVASNVSFGLGQGTDTGSPEENSQVTGGPEAGGQGAISREDVERALRVAQASEFVDQMPGGPDAPIEQGGRNVSGGQRQRLAIARAIARKPEILIFDDSFSALDFATDKALRAALDAECADVTRLVVAQRVSTIRDADLIVVLDEGRVVGQGTHAQLLESCDAYREIVLSQTNGEEVPDAS